jgi:hypothetical protein
MLPLAALPAAARDNARAEHDRIVAYWTRDRIANAVPRDFVRAGGAIKPAKRPPKPPPGGGGTGSVTGASWNAGGPILARSGRVYFTMGGGNWICSGSVVDDSRSGYSLVLTAGHCAIDETNGQFASYWMFIPAFDTNPTYTCSASTYGCWTAVGLAVHNQFATAGSFNNQAVTNDWALAIVGAGGKSGSAQLDDIVGSYTIGFSGVASGNKLYAFGYPAASPYSGSDLVYCAGNISQDVWTGNQTWGMGCNMTGGSSGGPWLSGFEDATVADTLSSVNSYKYGNTASMYGPKFNSRTQATYSAAQSAIGNVKATGG